MKSTGKTQAKSAHPKKSRGSHVRREKKFEAASRVDGNAAGGLFAELFALDLTAARAKCAGCGAAEVVGALLVYAHGMGMVARCPHCEAVVMRMSRTPSHIWLDASGATSIAVSAP
jgi:Family of unknown function (DUF6510)